MTSGTGTCSVSAAKAADSDYKSTISAAATVSATLANQATLTVTGNREQRRRMERRYGSQLWRQWNRRGDVCGFWRMLQHSRRGADRDNSAQGHARFRPRRQRTGL